jgi:hypothetical protein
MAGISDTTPDAERVLTAVYLRRWAGELRVEDLLDRLLAEAPAE